MLRVSMTDQSVCSKSSVPLSFNLKWLKSKIYEITNVRKSEFARHSNLHNSAVMQATPLTLEVWLAPSKPDDHVYVRVRKHCSEQRKASSRWLLCTRAVLSSGGRTERLPQGLSPVSSFYCTKLTYHLNFYISSRVNKTQTPFQSERISIFEMS